jgi:hypothetical protein
MKMLSEPHKRRIAVARFKAERARALADDPTPLRRARLNAGMSADALCALAFVSRRTLNRAEREGAQSVSPATQRRLASALGCRVADLLS